MSYRLPPADHPDRAYFDMPSLVETLAPQNVRFLPTLTQAILHGRANGSRGPEIATTYVCLCENDDRVLLRVVRDGGWKQLWNFGNGRD